MWNLISVTPQRSKDYWIYMIVYLILLWSVFFFISTIKMLPDISENGYVVKVTNCPDDGECGDEYSYWASTGTQIKDNFKFDGISAIIVVIIVGLIGKKAKKNREKEEKEVWDILYKAHREYKITFPQAKQKFKQYTKGYVDKHDVIYGLENKKVNIDFNCG